MILATLQDEWGVRRTLERYCRFVDDNDFSSLVELFTPDAVLEFGGRVLSGRPEIAGYFSQVHGSGGGPATGVHLLGPCIVDIDQDTAHARTDFVHVWRVGEGAGEDAAAVLAGEHLGQIPVSGRYVDVLRRQDDGDWLLARRSSALFATSPRKAGPAGD